MKPENQNASPLRNERCRTTWSGEHHENQLCTSTRKDLRNYIAFVLWECSTEFMVTQGLPTNADVEMWVQWLQSRDDAGHVDILLAIADCKEYMR